MADRLELRSSAEKTALIDALEELLQEGALEEIKRGKYKSLSITQYAEGRVDMTKSGSAYIIIDGVDEDIYISPSKMKGAFQGDTVKVLLYARSKNRRPEGEVVEILQRKKEQFTGILQVHEKFAFLVPDSKKIPVDIFVPISRLNGAKNGEKVLVKVLEWASEGSKSPIGEVIKIFGKPGEHFAEMNAIIAEFDLPEEFPYEVEKEAKAIPEEITEEEIAKRWDFRGTPTFTIDPEDAKDFDDALSVKKTTAGWEIGIHIADVSHYVKENTALDKEALERGTSVYLVDRVIPMLPENLSNNLCSLRPDEDKLCFSVVVTLDENANIKKEWYGRTVIRSLKRFSYEEAQTVLETGEGVYAAELLRLNSLAYKLREKKFAHGAISFESEEVKFILDKNGKPTGVYKKVRKDAHKLIEDFMLLANRKVAEFIFKKDEELHDRPFVYRVHDTPAEEKLANFSRVAARFGHVLNFSTPKSVANSMNKLLAEIEGKPEQNILQNLAIRSMPKAFYTTHKSSHYGLAFDYYTHFTSPIRRFPDVIAHRLLARYLEGKKGMDQDYIESQAKHSSEMEIRAAEAERASIKYKQVEYMLDKIGDVFEGLISGVTDWGIYVEIIENKCEGMVRMSSLDDDYYVLDEAHYIIRGTNSGKMYQLGDIVKVKVIEANLQQRTIDFAFAEEELKSK